MVKCDCFMDFLSSSEVLCRVYASSNAFHKQFLDGLEILCAYFIKILAMYFTMLSLHYSLHCYFFCVCV